jgi:hypothetical protein
MQLRSVLTAVAACPLLDEGQVPRQTLAINPTTAEIKTPF